MPDENASRRGLTPFRVGLIFLAVSYTWIIGTAVVVYVLAANQPWDLANTVEVLKGLGFVTATAGLLYMLMRKMTQRILEQRDHAEMLELRYRAIFEAIPEPTFLIDDKDMSIISVNTAATMRYGWTIEEFAGLNLREIRPQEEVKDLEEYWKTAGPGIRADRMFRHRSKSGEVFPVRVRSAPITIDGRSARISVAIDMTEIINTREDLQRANNELLELNTSLESRIAERTDRLRKAVTELEWFGEVVSHDLKQPVNYLRSLATDLAIKSKEHLTPQEQEIVHRMVGSSARLAHLIDDLLGFARSEGNDRSEPLSLVLMVSEVLGQLRREQGEACRVTLREPLYWAQAHRATLMRVISSLLQTAMVGCNGAKGTEVILSAQQVGQRVLLHMDCDATMVAEVGAKITAAGNQMTPTVLTGEMAVILRSVARINGRVSFVERTPERSVIILDLPAVPAA